MRYRTLGKTGYRVSTVSFGAWAIGGTWGEVSDEDALAALHRALDLGVNFFDTADVYGDGRSERLIARLRRERPEADFHVATKAGRRLDPHVAAGYTLANLRGFVERSRSNLEMPTLDLLQLHCPPGEVYDLDEAFDALDTLRDEGLIRQYGVSVETVDEAQRAIRHPGVATVQIIFNAFRLKPAESFFAAAQAADVGIIARVPLASGLLTGKLSAQSTFAQDDHRNFNRQGESFDKGETFSGVEYAAGLAAVEDLRPLVPAGESMAQFALRFILSHPEVSCTIPGAKNPAQVEDNVRAADEPSLSEQELRAVRDVYDQHLRADIHPQW